MFIHIGEKFLRVHKLREIKFKKKDKKKINKNK